MQITSTMDRILSVQTNMIPKPECFGHFEGDSLIPFHHQFGATNQPVDRDKNFSQMPNANRLETYKSWTANRTHIRMHPWR